MCVCVFFVKDGLNSVCDVTESYNRSDLIKIRQLIVVVVVVVVVVFVFV